MRTLVLPQALAIAFLLAASSASAAVDVRNPAATLRFDSDTAIKDKAEPSIPQEESPLIQKVQQMGDNPKAAIALLEGSYNPSKASAIMDYVLGSLNFSAGNNQMATRYYESAIRKAPNFLRVYKNLAMVALGSVTGENKELDEKNYDRALTCLLKTIELGSREGAVYGLIGYIYLQKEMFSAAESAYRQAIIRMPANLDWKLGLLRSMINQEKNTEAVAELEVLLAMDPKKTDYWLLESNAFINMDQPTQAAYDYEIMDRMGIATEKVYNALGNVYLTVENPALAYRAYLKALEKDPAKSFTSVMNAAEFFAARQMNEESSTLVQRLSDALRDKADVKQRIRMLKLQAQLALSSEDATLARAKLTELIQLDPDDVDTSLILARLHVRAKAFDQAVKIYEKLETDKKLLEKSQARKLAEVYTEHARTFVAQEGLPNIDRAIAMLEKAQIIYPTDNVARYLESISRYRQQMLK